MRKHQRYFPVYSEDGNLLPRFVSIANGPVDVELVTAGNFLGLAHYMHPLVWGVQCRKPPYASLRVDFH